jgi:hypothetical protein
MVRVDPSKATVALPALVRGIGVGEDVGVAHDARVSPSGQSPLSKQPVQRSRVVASKGVERGDMAFSSRADE